MGGRSLDEETRPSNTKEPTIDAGDARFLYDLIERMLAAPANRALEGGMGWYPATAAHPPFVHVDVRGSRARWQG